MSEFNVDEKLAEKRRRLIENYANYSSGDETSSSLASMSDADFAAKLMSMDYREAVTTTTATAVDDRLLETAIRFALTYLEEFDYSAKILGLDLLEHICAQSSPTQLKMNMRAELIRDTLSRYVYDKESLEFMDRANAFMVTLLGIIETKFNTNEHYFKQTSAYIESILNNCYMSTDPQAKAIYFKHLKPMVIGVGPLACRHLDRLLTVVFDSVEQAKSNAVDLQQLVNTANASLMLASLDLMQALIQACFYRIHSHSRRIIQFLLKLVYSYCQARMGNAATATTTTAATTTTTASLDLDDEEKENNMAELNLSNGEQFRLAVCLKSVRLVKMLFRNDRIRCSFYDDFKQVKSDAHLNRNFLKLIENI